MKTYCALATCCVSFVFCYEAIDIRLCSASESLWRAPTQDQYFGPTDSVSKIVVSDTKTGYGDKVLDGNGFPCMVEQQVSCGLVCVFEDGVHSPCNTHDNFLHPLFDVFFRRPRDIWRLDRVWGWEPMLKDLYRVSDSQISPASRVLKLFCPKMKYPQAMSYYLMTEMHKVKGFEQKMKALKDAEDKALAEMREEQAAMLDRVRAQLELIWGCVYNFINYNFRKTVGFITKSCFCV